MTPACHPHPRPGVPACVPCPTSRPASLIPLLKAEVQSLGHILSVTGQQQENTENQALSPGPLRCLLSVPRPENVGPCVLLFLWAVCVAKGKVTVCHLGSELSLLPACCGPSAR